MLAFACPGPTCGLPVTCRDAQILYADGQSEVLVLALERVRLLMHPGERLPPPAAGPLCLYAGKLLELAATPQYRKQAVRLRQRAAELRELGKQREVVEQAAVLAASPEQQQAERRREEERRAAGSEAPRPQARPQHQQQQRDAGPVKEEAGQQGQLGVAPRVKEEQQEQPSMPQQSADPAQPTSALAAPGAGALGFTMLVEAPQQQQQQQHGGLQPPAGLQGQAGARRGAGGGPASEAEQVLQPGEVGWYKAAGFLHWPFMTITREEAISRGVPGTPRRTSPPPMPPPAGSDGCQGKAVACLPAAPCTYGQPPPRCAACPAHCCTPHRPACCGCAAQGATLRTPPTWRSSSLAAER